MILNCFNTLLKVTFSLLNGVIISGRNPTFVEIYTRFDWIDSIFKLLWLNEILLESLNTFNNQAGNENNNNSIKI